MKNFTLFLLITLVSLNTDAQLISRFTWESNPATKAAYGMNAISISSYATVCTGGTHGSNGLNPGTGSNDINLVLDGAAFNVPAIDIAVDFRREESQASFFYRGANFNFGMNNGSLAVNFPISNGNTFSIVNSGNVYTVPNDHLFHSYRFSYDNNTGVARIWVDAALVYTYNGVAGTALYWTGAGNVTIGKDMDATGRNIPVLDNLIIQQYANALLPLKLLSFSAEAKNKLAVINWNTTEELNATAFVLERSADGIYFSALKNIAASNGYNGINRYQAADSLPAGTTMYYRLKMINDNGSFTYSAVKSVTFSAARSEMNIFPNPTTDYVTVKINNAAAGKYVYTASSITGQVISAATAQLNGGAQLIKIDLTKTTVKGIIIIKLSNTLAGTTETFTVVKS